MFHSCIQGTSIIFSHSTAALLSTFLYIIINYCFVYRTLGFTVTFSYMNIIAFYPYSPHFSLMPLFLLLFLFHGRHFVVFICVCVWVCIYNQDYIHKQNLFISFNFPFSSSLPLDSTFPCSGHPSSGASVRWTSSMGVVLTSAVSCSPVSWCRLGCCKGTSLACWLKKQKFIFSLF